MKVLVINAGSSSLKYQLIDVEKHNVLAKGICERVGSEAGFHKHCIDDNEYKIDLYIENHEDAVAIVLDTLINGEDAAIKSLDEIDAIGHRIVQGGKYFKSSVLIDDDVIAKIDELSELAPLHNKAALMGIYACKKHLPNVPMVAVFDTSFSISIIHRKKWHVFAFIFCVDESLLHFNNAPHLHCWNKAVVSKFCLVDIHFRLNIRKKKF